MGDLQKFYNHIKRGDYMSQNLEPCPFCGSERVGFDAFVEVNGEPAEGAVTCTDCGASGPITSTLDIDSDLDNSDAGEAVVDKAVEQWNSANNQ